MGEQSSAVQRAQEPSGPKIVKFETLVERIDSVFNHIARRAYQIFEGHGSQHGHDVEDWLKAERELLCPVDIEMTETDKTLQIKAEVHGFNEKELEVSVEPTRLTITGKHETSKEETKDKMVYSETMASDILRVVALPAEVDAAKVTATVKNGVLNITVPKAAKVQTVRVSTPEERKPKEEPMSASAEHEARIANEMGAEMDEREEGRLQDERTEQEDLNQGMATGTHDSTHRGVKWPPSYRTRSKAAKPNQGPKDQENG